MEIIKLILVQVLLLFHYLEIIIIKVVLFGNNNNTNTQSGTGLFWNNTNNNQGNSLFNDKSTSLFSNNNNNQGGGLFGNNNNSTSTNNNTSLFGNNNNNQGGGLFGNNNNNNGGGSLFGNNNTGGGSLFSNNQNNNTNKSTGTSLFGNSNTTSLFGNNTTTNNTNNTFGTTNTNSNMGLFGQKFSGTSTTGTSLFSNSNINTQTQTPTLFCNNTTQQTNNNNLIFNQQNSTLYSDITYDDIKNPLTYINTQRTLKPSPQDELLSKSIIEAVQKQKSVQEFLDDLDEKYKNSKNNEDNNTDVLSSYGTYLTSTNNYDNYDTDKNVLKRSLNVNINNDSLSSSSYKNIKYRNVSNYNNEISGYNKIALDQSISKINDIYDEYEKYKKKLSSNSNGNIYMQKAQNENYNINEVEMNNTLKKDKIKIEKNAFNKDYKKTIIKNNSNGMIGRDEGLYQKNIIELNKLSNYNITSGNSNQYDENNEILITNYHNEKENNEMVDLVIKYKLPEEEDKNMLKIHLENINQYIKIQTLREEIKSRILNEIKLRGLDKKYSIDKISLLIPGGFLVDNKLLKDYLVNDFDFNIQVFITYNSISGQKKNI